jgi:hypothetical protein
MKMQKKVLLAIALIILATTFIAVRMPLASADLQLALGLSIPSTAKVVDYSNGVYAVGTTTGDLYIINNVGQYTLINLAAGPINDVRIEHTFIAVAAGNTVIMLSLSGLTPHELWRTALPGWGTVVSTDLSSDGQHVCYLAQLSPWSYTQSGEVGVLNGADGSLISRLYTTGYVPTNFWLDATNDMEYIAVSHAQYPPYFQVGVGLYHFDGSALTRLWWTLLVTQYDVAEVRISENKDYVAAVTSSGTEMCLLDLPTGAVLSRYDAHGEQFAVDGDDDLNYVIGGTKYHPWYGPVYKWLVFKNNAGTLTLLAEGNMNGNVDDLDSTPDASYFAFGSDAGEVILLGRTGDTVATLFTTSGLPRIDAIEIGSDSPLHSLLVGGDNFINLYVQQQYYLTVKTDPPGIATIGGEGWYVASADVTLTAPAFGSGGYRFWGWDIDGSQVAGNLITVQMNADHTATAHYSNPAVGGEWAPINMLHLLAQYIVLALIGFSALAAGSWRLLKKRW